MSALASGRITLTTNGIVTVDDTTTADVSEVLQKTMDSKYGYVSTSDSKVAIGAITVAAGKATIPLTKVTLAKGKTLNVTIENVKASGAGAYTWDITDDNNDENELKALDTDKEPVLFVLETVTDAVTLSADKASLEAGSEETIVFTFTATKTPITGGYVKLQIPSTLSASGPTTTG